MTADERGSTRGIVQLFAYLVSIPSRWLANDRRSLPLNAGSPPVCIPLARIVSMKSRMLSLWRMVSVDQQVKESVVRCRSGSAKAGLQRPAGFLDGKQPGLPQQVCVQAHGVYSDSEAPRNRT